MKCSWPALQLWTLSPSYLENSCCFGTGHEGQVLITFRKLNRTRFNGSEWISSFCAVGPLYESDMWLNKAKQFQELLTGAEWLKTGLNTWREKCNDDNKRIHVVNEIVPLSCSRSIMCSCLRPRRPWRRPEPCVNAEVGPVDVSSNVKGCWRMSRTGVAVSSPMDELWVFVVTHVSLYIRQQNMWAASIVSVYFSLSPHNPNEHREH